MTCAETDAVSGEVTAQEIREGALFWGTISAPEFAQRPRQIQPPPKTRVPPVS